jgi:putative acetyltransferase
MATAHSLVAASFMNIIQLQQPSVLARVTRLCGLIRVQVFGILKASNFLAALIRARTYANTKRSKPEIALRTTANSPMTTRFAFTIAIESPEQPGIKALLQESDDYHSALYPDISNHLLDVSALMQPHVVVFAARHEQQLLGMGAALKYTDYAEIKRMYVPESLRGRGVGQSLLAALEGHVWAVGIDVMRLETGIKQPEALSLYRRAGYVECEPFGAYQADPLSVFMEKRLDYA